jgi:hypothetical protein
LTLGWASRTVELIPDASLPQGFDPAEVLAALRGAARSWSPAGACSDVTVTVAEPRAGLAVGYLEGELNQNVVVFVTEGWPHGPRSVALTTTTYRPSTGATVDADVEINVAGFALSTRSQPDPARWDLQSVLTHEVGHVLGLDHTCDDGSSATPLLDLSGQPAPQCCPGGKVGCSVQAARGFLGDQPEVVSATMFSFGDPGETHQRTPEADDLQGLCALYPRTEGGGPAVLAVHAGLDCQATPIGAPPAAAMPVVLALLALALSGPGRRSLDLFVLRVGLGGRHRRRR